MSDIVEQLRYNAPADHGLASGDLMREAAAEIERLREVLSTIALWYIDHPRDAEDMAKYASEALGRDALMPVGRKMG